MRKQQFFVYGYNGWKNTGDDAMTYALLQELHVSNANAKFAVLALAPIVIPSEVKSKTSFVKLAPLAVFWGILKSSTFIIGGGTWMHDYGKCVRNMRTLLILSALSVLAKLSGSKVFLVGHGLGPLTTIWGKTLAKWICQMANYISVRDKTSYEILKAWGFANKSTLAFDISALIEPLDKTRISHLTKGGNNKRILGISITPVFELYYSSRKKDLLLIDRMAEQINEWLERDTGAEVYLFVFKGKSKDDDVLITGLLKDRLRPAERIKLVPYNPDPQSMLAQVGQCSAFVGTKYHSCLFAYLNRIPLLIINYHPKCYALASEIGLPKHAVVSLEDVLNGKFGERLKNLAESPKNFCTTLPIGLAKKKARAGIKIING